MSLSTVTVPSQPESLYSTVNTRASSSWQIMQGFIFVRYAYFNTEPKVKLSSATQAPLRPGVQTFLDISTLDALMR